VTSAILNQYQFYQSSTTLVSLPSLAPLLDTYPNASIAYSFRKLRSAYAGSAVRIRRSSDNTEQDIGFVGNDFDAASASSFIGGGSGFISKWYDQSGNGADLSQTTSTQQPDYSASTGIGTKPCLHYDLTNIDQLLTADDAVTINSTTASCFSVANVHNSTNYGRLLFLTPHGSGSPTAVGGFLVSQYGVGAAMLTQDNEGQNHSAITLDTAFTISVIYDGSNGNLRIYDSGLAQWTHTGVIGNASGAKFWTGAQTSVAYITAYHGEAVLWASDQSSNRSGIDSNQRSYWGI